MEGKGEGITEEKEKRNKELQEEMDRDKRGDEGL